MRVLDRCDLYTAARECQAAGLYPYFQPIERSDDAEVVIQGERKVMAGSNNYLGLTHHPLVLERAREALARYGSGCTGSPLLNGTLDLHLELEAKLARLLGTEAALVFSTGYQANLGVVSTLLRRGDHLYMDRLNHASLVDGGSLSGAVVHRYPHGDLATLERQLAAAPPGAPRLIATDGVFSMEGDICDLPGLVELAERYGADLLVDDAHALGVLGARGGGTAQHFGMEGRVSLTVATFSKSLASIGGMVAGPESVLHFLRHHSRPFIFSASMPPPSVATVLAALEVMEREPERREALWRNTRETRAGLVSMGFDVGRSETPVIPVVIGEMLETFAFWKALFEAGVFTNPVTPPAVPPGECRLRVSLMATHTPAHVERILDGFDRARRRLARASAHGSAGVLAAAATP